MIMRFSLIVLLIFYLVGHVLSSPSALAHSANDIRFEFRPDGRYRVYVGYTIPDLKEFREVYVDFNTKKEAEAFYWNVVRGADFHLPSPKSMHFHTVPTAPAPW